MKLLLAKFCILCALLVGTGHARGQDAAVPAAAPKAWQMGVRYGYDFYYPTYRSTYSGTSAIQFVLDNANSHYFALGIPILNQTTSPRYKSLFLSQTHDYRYRYGMGGSVRPFAGAQLRYSYSRFRFNEYYYCQGTMKVFQIQLASAIGLEAAAGHFRFAISLIAPAGVFFYRGNSFGDENYSNIPGGYFNPGDEGITRDADGFYKGSHFFKRANIWTQSLRLEVGYNF